MLPRAFLVLLLALPAFTSQSQTIESPVASGYVTSVDHDGTFAIEGFPVHLDPNATYAVRHGKETYSQTLPIRLCIGDFVTLGGHRDKRSGLVTASSLTIVAPVLGPVSGYAIIDKLPDSPNQLGDRVVRADGYLLHLTPKTNLTLESPLASAADLHTNVWIEYHGTEQPDGSVLLDRASVHANKVAATEDKLRDKAEFNAAAVTSDHKQGRFSRGFKGLDPTRIPALNDPALQARLDRVGQTLVPAYQRNLVATDPTRINFRFQLVAEIPLQRVPLTLPSGIILVPKSVLERFPDDAQLAAILAGSVAEAIEKDTLRFRPVHNAGTATEFAGYAVGAFVPGASLAGLTAGGVASHVLKLQRQQRDRVSLSLLEDAGYDLAQAPIAWWLIVDDHNGPITEIHPPAQTTYLYQVLATVHRPTSDATLHP